MVHMGKEFSRLTFGDWPVYPNTDDFVPCLVAAMFVEAVVWWLEHGRPYTPEEITNKCAILTAAIFKETITWTGSRQ